MNETVSDEAREDQWGVRSIPKGAAYRKERLVIFKEDRIYRWTSKSDHR